MSNTPQTEPISDFMERHFAHLRDGRKEYTEAEVRSIMLAFEAELRRLDTAHTVAVELAAKYAAERDQLRAQVEQMQGGEPVSNWPLKAKVWKRENTQEWVLDIEGTLGETNMTCRHTQPLSVAYEDVPGLPTLYREPVTLTDAEIEAIARKHGTGGWQTLPDMGKFAHAIISALREKEREYEQPPSPNR